MPIHIPVTLLYAALCGLLIFALGLRVSLTRIFKKVPFNGPPEPSMHRLIRAHGNAIEWVPLQLLLLLLIELAGGHSRELHLLGGTILLARVVHAIGLQTKTRLTVVGAALSYVVTVLLSIRALELR